MNATAEIATTGYRDLAHDVFSLLQSIDPSRLRAGKSTGLVEQAEGLAGRLRQATAAAPASGAVEQQLTQVASVLDAPPAAGGDWETFRRSLHVAYDDLVELLRRESIDLPTVRPTNYARSFFHVLSAVGAAALVHALEPRTTAIVAGTAALAGWTMEAARRLSPAANRVMMGVFKHVAHEHERHRINSSTWYTTALLILSLTMPPLAVTAALLVLGVGDPMAGLIGRRWGRTKLVGGRSLEGSLAFVAAGGIAAAVALLLIYPTLGLGPVAALAGTAALAGALAELLVRKVDDNFSIPVAAGAGCSLVAALLGVIAA